MKKIFTFFIILYIISPAFSQSNFIDSLEQLIPAATFSERVKLKYRIGPFPIGTENDLYKIPYVNNANKWLGDQYHYRLDTTKFVDGNYNLVLELFDDLGNLVQPQGIVGATNPADFHFINWEAESDSAVVNFPNLIHNILINNTPCVAEIKDVRKGTTNVSGDCQFLEGDAGSDFVSGFIAYQEDGFMQRFSYSYRKGLSNDQNDRGNFDEASPIQSPNSPNLRLTEEKDFSVMLNGSPKCTFALDLVAVAKHTNGRGFLTGYNARDIGSFALEIIPPSPTSEA